MSKINFKKEIPGTVEGTVAKVIEALKSGGFGVLTRIDFHTKMKEKLNKDIAPTVILGACNPQLAYDAFQQNTDVTSLIPCNVVVRELSVNKVSIEIAKPSALLGVLDDPAMSAMAQDTDKTLLKILETL